MIQPAPLALKPPRISANQLGEFIFATDAKKISILQDQKFGNVSAAPYYAMSLAGARRSLLDGQFSVARLLAEAELVANREAETSRQATKWANNALALRSIAVISTQCNPPAGDHRHIHRNAQLLLDDVTVSIMPEIVTESLTGGYIAFTKLRFSKSKITLDVSEIVLLLLHYYGQRQSRAGLTFAFEQSKVIDCFSKTVILGHEIRRVRDQQIHRALAEIRQLWPRIEPK